METVTPAQAATAATAGSAAGARPGAVARSGRDAARDALHRARAQLLSLQDPAGWWKGDLLTNVTMEAEDLFVRHALGILTAADIDPTARWIRSQQGADGGWALWPGAPGDVSTTVEAYVALRLAGDDPDAPHLRAAAALIATRGGLAATRVFTRIWLALLGFSSWDDVPALPPELVLLPERFPLALPQWACWARQTVVPLTVVAAHRPSYPLDFDLVELSPGTAPTGRPWSVSRAFLRLDGLLHRYEHHPVARLRRRALRESVRWITDRQEADGSWGGIQPPWVWSLLALVVSGRELSDPVVARGLAGLERFTLRGQTPDGPVRHLEACQSPVWDTALAVVALTDSGLPVDHDALVRAGRWLVEEEVRVPGDWQVRRPDLAPGGWSFEFDNDLYPDVDDTAEVALALSRVPAAHGQGAVSRGLDWLTGMQCADGGWAAFDADQTGTWPARLPFCDFGEVIDPPSADVTAHAVEVLCRYGRRRSEAVSAGVRWLLAHQEDDGSWFGRWGVNHVYGTGSVLPALAAARLPVDHPAMLRASRWLVEHQDASGGWGEDVASYRDPALRGRGEPTPSQTAWALLGLLAAGGHDDAVDRGVAWLVRTQRADGGWDEDVHTGTGFPGDFSISYGLYRLVFPLSALGRYLGRRR